MRDISERLRDIQEAIRQITKYTELGRQSFDQDELIRIWVIHHLEIISEATRAIPQEFKNNHPEVPWQQISRMRNVLIHIYFGVDLDIIWKVVEQDLPVLYPGRHLFHDPVVPLDSARTLGDRDRRPHYTALAGAAGLGNRGSQNLAKGIATARGARGASPASGRDSPVDNCA